MYENIHVLNLHVNKFLWIPYKNILARNLEIAVHVCMYCLHKQTHAAVLSITIGDKHLDENHF